MVKIGRAFLTGALSLGILLGVGTANKTEASSFDTITVKANSIFSLSPNGKLLHVQDSRGKTVYARNLYDLPDLYYYDDDNSIHGYDVKYVDYDRTSGYKTSVKTQVYTKASLTSALIAHTSKGKIYKIQISKDTLLTKVNSKWYKGSIKYMDYKKIGKKWVKKTKTARVYVPYNKVKPITIWKKHVKEALNGYFSPWKREGITLAEYNQIQIGMTYNQVAEYPSFSRAILNNNYMETIPFLFFLTVRSPLLDSVSLPFFLYYIIQPNTLSLLTV
ncbi:hypothetical protein E2K98_24340 [Bacillus salipaludis]|uniref:Uncharacterized protein n=1 Tax=Bacillus salipaludis TaxID=2547811 RepID=A0A4R5VLW4_9BACI|nr:hypothetical protein [Bacillus salipaludis]MDQ6598894.1 hypothetical protein [Bacillus salipaludis]TDK58204.1 hypothetical protein E2K98_24340 [Bacillus salipaludis]